jgi:hypothetical protein
VTPEPVEVAAAIEVAVKLLQSVLPAGTDAWVTVAKLENDAYTVEADFTDAEDYLEWANENFVEHTPITPRVQQDIARQKHRPGCDRLLSLLHQRTEKGIQEYGRPLRTNDGHDFLTHLTEELADATQYTMGALMDMELQGGDRSKLQRIYSSLLDAALTVEEMRMNRE